MLTALALLVVSAAPPVGSEWTWTIDDQRALKLTSPKGELSVDPHLEKMTLEVTVTEASEEALRKFTVFVKAGNVNLRNLKFEVESNYGEAVVKDVTPNEGKRRVGLNELTIALATGAPAPELPAFRRALAQLFKADPIVAAAKGAKCTPETGAAVAKAVGETMMKIKTERDNQETVTNAAGTCVGADGTKYAVSFTLNAPFRDQTTEVSMKGTVTVPADAWRASWDASGPLHMKLQTGKKPIQIDGTIGLKTSFTSKKKK